MTATRRFLVTAGNTRERIDEVRDWGNIFTGNTGFAIARALAETKLGDVELLTSNAAHVEGAPRFGICAVRFSSHADLKALLEARMSSHIYDAIFMTAAVADYRPIRVYSVLSREKLSAEAASAAGTAPQERWLVTDAQAGKVKSNHPLIAVLGEPTEKLVDLFRSRWNHRGLLVKFKLEVDVSTERLLEIGRASRVASGADFLVANTLQMVRSDRPGAYLIGEKACEWIDRPDLPGRMAALIQPPTSRQPQ